MRATRFFHWNYVRILRPILFRFEAEAIHHQFITLGAWLGRRTFARILTHWCFHYEHPALRQTLADLTFPNPIGLAAGFDKDARAWRIFPAVGFGLMEMGSITARPCAGNPRPRLWRWPARQSLIVNYGLVNDGVENVAYHLPKEKSPVPLGLNVAVTNTQEILTVADAVADYLASLRRLRNLGDYFTINLSCPNRLSDKLFFTPENLETLLTAVDRLQLTQPVFLKLSPDLSEAELEAVVNVAEHHQVTGFVAGNLTKDRQFLDDNQNLPPGGLSGLPVRELSDKQIAWLYRRLGHRYLIIGCGGIFTAADAYRKLRLGASLLQLITGMIYEGPQLIGEINRDLVTLLRRDGFTNIRQVIGLDA